MRLPVMAPSRSSGTMSFELEFDVGVHEDGVMPGTGGLRRGWAISVGLRIE